MTHAESFRRSPTLSFRTVALVGRYAHRHLDVMMQAAVGCDVVFVESLAHAYSKIKRVRPDLVILRISSDDPEGCQLLSMLALDADTARIPVLTQFTPGFDNLADEVEPDADSGALSHPIGPISLH